MIPFLQMLIFFYGRLNLIHSARLATRKKNLHLMFSGSVPWLGTPGLWCRVVCKSYRTKEMILLGLCYGCFRIFQRTNWKTGLSQRGQSGPQGIVSFLKLIKRALSTSEEKLSFYFESIIKRRLPTVLYKVLFVYFEWEVLLILLVCFCLICYVFCSHIFLQ